MTKKNNLTLKIKIKLWKITAKTTITLMRWYYRLTGNKKEEWKMR